MSVTPTARRMLLAGGLGFLFLAQSSCAAPEADLREELGSTEQALDSRSATATAWGSDLWTAPAATEARPNAYWPGVFDQPGMTTGPGACGFTAVANVTAQLLSRPGAPENPISPWDALDRRSYNTWVGIYPGSVMAMLDEIFADASIVGNDLVGTTFEWHREGWGYANSAWNRLRSSLASGRPFIALVSYGNEGSSNFKSNHYVTVVRVTPEDLVLIAHWGKYEKVAKSSFLAWWGNHGVYSYAGIYPTQPSRLSTATLNGQSLAP